MTAAMSQPSLTMSESFQFRAQRSEQSRAALMAGVFAAVLITIILRRIAHGAVMVKNAVFVPNACILAAAIIFELIVWRYARQASRASRLVPRSTWIATAIFELAVPIALLSILHWNSPQGEFAALSAAVVLLFPIIIIVSILRLRPWFPLGMGVGAAVAHASLAALTLDDLHAPLDQAPAAFAFAVLLLFNGAAAALVTRAARRYVIEAVAEATERERAALRLANIERDLSVAREIQLGLLPKDSPALPGFDIAGMNKPADQTGGDYYDWQDLPDGRLIVVMADVTGHGIGPALVMAVCRAYARASATVVAEPGALLAKLNNLLHADLGGARFITLAMALLDQDGNVELLSAGHGPTLLFHAADRSVERYGGDGIPLGIEAGQAYGPSRTLKLQRDDVLVMLTDGFFEYPNSERQQFGLDRLVETLKEAAPMPAAKIIDHLYRAVLDFAAGAPQTDDLTVVAIKRTA